jgi:hypothetical protein
LPPLKESDPAMIEAFSRLLGSEALSRFFDLEEVARRIVATVDNLPRESYATRLNPVKPIGGTLRVSGSDETLAIAPAKRRAIRGLRPACGVRRCREPRLPSTRASIRSSSRPTSTSATRNGYFNDRLVAVIDHLLQTPEVAGPIRLTVPHVLYEFADPRLEERSAGQKALLRMGRRMRRS